MLEKTVKRFLREMGNPLEVAVTEIDRHLAAAFVAYGRRGNPDERPVVDEDEDMAPLQDGRAILLRAAADAKPNAIEAAMRAAGDWGLKIQRYPFGYYRVELADTGKPKAEAAAAVKTTAKRKPKKK